MRAPLALSVGLLLLVTACTPIVHPPAPVATATLAACTSSTGNTESQPSILPTFTPAYACELEQAYQQISYCLVQASPDLSYPCTRTEAVTETLLGQSDASHLIQRDVHFSAGCWHGTSSDTRSLKVCDSHSGENTLVMAGIFGELSPHPMAHGSPLRRRQPRMR